MNKSTDSIIRYCKPTQVQNKTVLAGAFSLRKKDPVLGRPEDEETLSVHQYEFFPVDSLKKLKKYLTEHHFHLSPNGCFAIIKYSEIEKDIKDNLFIDIDITQDTNSPHCLISNLYQHDEDAAYYFLKSIKSVEIIKDIN